MEWIFKLRTVYFVFDNNQVSKVLGRARRIQEFYQFLVS